MASVLNGLLSSDEKERAARFGREDIRQSFVLGRGALRSLLGRYLGVDPASVRFNYGPHGKPAIEGAAIQFNLTHSGGLIACAFAEGCEVGIDIELIRPGAASDEIASRFFSADEAEKMNALPRDERQTAFFRIWTRKEAYIKATGEGLAGIFKHVGEKWTVQDLKIASGYAGAVAYSGKPRAIALQDHSFGLT